MQRGSATTDIVRPVVKPLLELPIATVAVSGEAGVASVSAIRVKMLLNMGAEKVCWWDYIKKNGTPANRRPITMLRLIQSSFIVSKMSNYKGAL